MTDRNVPPISLLMDQLTVRIEWSEMQGLDDECAALRSARETIVDYVLREHRSGDPDQIRIHSYSLVE